MSSPTTEAAATRAARSTGSTSTRPRSARGSAGSRRSTYTRGSAGRSSGTALTRTLGPSIRWPDPLERELDRSSGGPERQQDPRRPAAEAWVVELLQDRLGLATLPGAQPGGHAPGFDEEL